MSRVSRQVLPTDTYLASLSTTDWATLARGRVRL